MVVWEWCDDNVGSSEIAPDGNAVVTLGSLPERTIDSLAGVTGFAIAMSNAGWLRLANVGVTFPHFDRNNGETAKDRALTAKRVAKNRKICNANVTRNVTPKPLRSPLLEERRGEESRVEKKSKSAFAFCKPSLAEVETHIADHAIEIDAEAFHAYYESNGWRVGRSPMKSWQAAVVNWKKRQGEFTNGKNGRKDTSPPEFKV